MADTLLFRGGSTADISLSTTTINDREIVIDTTTDEIVVNSAKKRTVVKDSNGNVKIPGTLSIGGTAAANTIDEYEEGIYSENEEGTGKEATLNADGDPATHVNLGTYKYNKIGRTVTCFLSLTINADTATTGFRISLPFSASASGSLHLVSSTGINFDSLKGYIAGGTMRCAVPDDHTSGGRGYRGTFTYISN